MVVASVPVHTKDKKTEVGIAPLKFFVSNITLEGARAVLNKYLAFLYGKDAVDKDMPAPITETFSREAITMKLEGQQINNINKEIETAAAFLRDGSNAINSADDGNPVNKAPPANGTIRPLDVGTEDVVMIEITNAYLDVSAEAIRSGINLVVSYEHAKNIRDSEHAITMIGYGLVIQLMAARNSSNDSTGNNTETTGSNMPPPKSLTTPDGARGKPAIELKNFPKASST